MYSNDFLKMQRIMSEDAGLPLQELFWRDGTPKHVKDPNRVEGEKTEPDDNSAFL